MIEAAITAVAAYSLFEPYWLKIRQYEVKSGKIPASFDGQTIIFISDIHCSPTFPLYRVRSLVKKINKLRPDIVVLGGDYISQGSSRILKVFKEFKKLKPRIASFGVLGNHDYVTDAELTRKGMRDAGIKSLENRGCWVQLGDGRIRVGGVSDPCSDIPQDIIPTLEETSADDFILLVCHNPSFISEIPESSVDFILSGHTHGGQVAPLGFLGSIFNQGFRSKHRKGIVTENGSKMLVSVGIGTVALPVRFMSKPEIVHITLRKV
ncbi:MAG: metallophosphoesterase [Candidatus Colwellbacteria bacterium]|nr:metallophosphoesterase [Candidatus Colwellbacteria bacterium]